MMLGDGRRGNLDRTVRGAPHEGFARLVQQLHTGAVGGAAHDQQVRDADLGLGLDQQLGELGLEKIGGFFEFFVGILDHETDQKIPDFDAVAVPQGQPAVAPHDLTVEQGAVGTGV